MTRNEELVDITNTFLLISILYLKLKFTLGKNDNYLYEWVLLGWLFVKQVNIRIDSLINCVKIDSLI